MPVWPILALKSGTLAHFGTQIEGFGPFCASDQPFLRILARQSVQPTPELPKKVHVALEIAWQTILVLQILREVDRNRPCGSKYLV